ncbi:MAG: thiazole synthase ThiG [Phormidesmis priestleyi Ana]|uniref:Thiazole synthase n=1 Tax=Phormidesmis priestleyi Ana TaxID=1666911 RepID=A0A0P7Z3Y3_9CYAN|nr:MAG: thiazole synthase ThiG [Phormidesmis priestleyi Ana]
MGHSTVLIVGGGVIGLAVALELRQRGTQVTVLSQDYTAAAGHAAAGMLAPSAEKIAPGPMAELCSRSLDLYPAWIDKLEKLTGQDSGYWPCGILAPVLAAEEVKTETGTVQLSAAAAHSYQPGLSNRVVSAEFYPDDAQIDNRALMKMLQLAAQDLGVEVQSGVCAEGFVQRRGQIVELRTSVGPQTADHYILATGAWSGELLPIPATPCKGQMLSVRVPAGYGQVQPLQRVLYGEKVYIVPRRDGRIVIGATVEDVGFAPHNTPAGVAQLLNAAVELYPVLKTFPIEECWWGFRPATPDEQPILGAGPCENLTLATGHHRNGILLAPITAQLIANKLMAKSAEPSDSDTLLSAFSYRRFTDFSTPYSLPSTPSASMQILDTPSLTNLSHPESNSLSHNPSHNSSHQPSHQPDELVIAGKTFTSRLMTGTGKFSSLETMRQSFAASGSEIVTVAVRRVQTNAPGHEGLAEAIDWSKIWMLPNTAGCKNAEEAIRVARLGREMAKLLGQEDNNFVKLEVIPDTKYLLPDPIDTLKAAEQLVKEGFAVLPYINADPLLAKRLEEVGCATVMPLGSPIGSGQGIRNAANIAIIIENANVPVVVDAGIGSPSEAAYAMELGADALLVNSAIALAKDPVAMGTAMGMAAKAGRLAYQAGRIPVKGYASASSPTTGTINS